MSPRLPDREARVRIAYIFREAICGLMLLAAPASVGVDKILRRDGEDRLWVRAWDGRCYLLQVIPIPAEKFEFEERRP